MLQWVQEPGDAHRLHGATDDLILHPVVEIFAVDGEGVVVPALVPGEAVVKMVFEFGGTVSRRRERLVGRDKSSSR